MRLEVPIPVIAHSVMQLLASRNDRKNWSQVIAVMRHGFGGHPFVPEPNIAGGETRAASAASGQPSLATAEPAR